MCLVVNIHYPTGCEVLAGLTHLLTVSLTHVVVVGRVLARVEVVSGSATAVVLLLLLLLLELDINAVAEELDDDELLDMSPVPVDHTVDLRTHQHVAHLVCLIRWK